MPERRPLPGARPPRSCVLHHTAELPDGHALRALCFGRIDARDDAAAAEALCRQLDLEADSLWVAQDRDGTLGAAALVYNPGGAVAFGSPMERDDAVHLVAAALDATCRHADRLRASVVEGIVRPHDHRIRAALSLAGFDHACELRDLRAPVPTEPPPRGSLSRVGLRVIRHDGYDDALFARALALSFVDSDDYDEAASRRAPSEHLQLMRWRRQFQPHLWRVLLAGEDPVGMWAMHVEGDALELAYVGLAPEWRGRGVGEVLLQRTVALAAELSLGAVTCVVKAANGRALRFYQRHGFEVAAHRLLVSRLA